MATSALQWGEVETMNGDPFGAVVDRAKLIFFGVRDYFLGLVEQEKKEFEAAKLHVIERDVIPTAGDDCPQCKTAGAMLEVSAGIVRCMQCAWQPRIVNPPGISRSQLESWSGYSPEHRAKFERGFGNALSRFGRRK
jgi:Zn ribbon nucleic-acid-binding protein